MAESKRTKHTDQDSTVSTRDDALDQGVPMLAGDPSEPVGPEDALGEGPKRGDYSKRLGDSSYEPHVAVRVPDAAPGEVHTRLVPQAPNVEDQGEVAGRKGGVQTAGE